MTLGLDLPKQMETFAQGKNFHAQDFLGAHRHEDSGYVFRVWAPNAQQIWLVGEFNDWKEDLPFQLGEHGIWSVHAKNAQAGQLYKFKIKQYDGNVVYKIDPFALRFEKRPHDAAIIYDIPKYKWSDGLWRGRKKRSNYFERPMNIYELHPGSWKEHPDKTPYTIAELTTELIPYLKKMNYTHVEFMPLMEHPLDASWGYQLIGYFALCSAYGTPEEFQAFVDACHQENIGVIVDWVPGHFCINGDTLPYYDGTATFEYADPDKAKNVGWGSQNFDLGKPEVQSFLLSSAFFWIEKFHLDGLRVDAVSNMIYLDYDQGPWKPNIFGDNRNLEGQDFLRKLNKEVKLAHSKVILIAEESSAGTKITGMLEENALGFDYKWNMGWMNDVLEFYAMDPLYRGDHLNKLTFSWMYRLAENYILPLSHDEVVHGKKSLLHKMWGGDRYRQFAQLRNLLTYQMTHPGKKLLFMGGEFGQFIEWRYYEGLTWDSLDDEMNQKMLHFTATLNEFYKEKRALWELEDKPESLEVIDADNRSETILSFIRHGKKKKDFVVVLMNLSTIEQKDFEIGVPYPGTYREVLNTEMEEFGGTWTKHNPVCHTKEQQFKHYDQVIKLTVPALGVLILEPEKVNLRYVNKKHLAKEETSKKKVNKRKQTKAIKYEGGKGRVK